MRAYQKAQQAQQAQANNNGAGQTNDDGSVNGDYEDIK